MISHLAVAGATLVAGVAFAAPASAAVNYDPELKKGFAGRGDVQKAFGWTEAQLAAKAKGLVFNHDFWTQDTYSVDCGAKTFPVVHPREFGRWQLFDVVVSGPRGSATGYGGKVTGFWITGPEYGISGTSVPPAVGQPCPDTSGKTIKKSRLVSTDTGWALAVSSGDESRRLLTKVTTTTS